MIIENCIAISLFYSKTPLSNFNILTYIRKSTFSIFDLEYIKMIIRKNSK